MILYEIKRETNSVEVRSPLVQQPEPQGNGVFHRWRSPQTQHHQVRRDPQGFNLKTDVSTALAEVKSVQGEVPAVPPLAMGSAEYKNWLNAYVFPYFKPGSKCTFKVAPYVPGEAPAVWFVVKEVQELYYHVVVDKDTRQPRAVGLVHKDFLNQNRSAVWYPPMLLRPLNTEELKSLDLLRNQAGERRDVEDAGTPADGTDKPDYAG